MGNDLKTYNQYKDSGYDWLGMIPEHWSLVKNKHFFQERGDKSEEGNEELLSVSQYTGITKRKDAISKVGISPAESLVGYKKVKEGDFVMNIMLAWNGSYAVSSFDGIVSPAYSVFKFMLECNHRYYHYLLRTNIYSGAFKTQSRGIIDSRLRLYPDKFYNFYSLFPPLSEQKQIATYLDYKLAMINKLIKAKKREIELLKEQKQAEINLAVTQGLNPDVPMKDSGVEWIGMIPEHWEVRRLKNSIQLINKKEEAKNSNLKYLGMENVESGTGRYVDSNGISEGITNYFGVDNILFGKLRPYLAKVFLATTEGLCSTEFLVYNTKENLPRYIQLMMLSKEFISVVDASTYGSKMPRANSEFIGNIRIPLAPLAEQKQIVDHITEVEGRINQAISTIESEIRLVEEYKTSLISEVVTGKVDVQDIVVPQMKAIDMEEEIEDISQEDESME